MEDMERYGDYNEVDTPPGRRTGLRVLAIIAALACFAVIALVVFRIIVANYYPASVKKIYFDPVLTEHYNSTGGNIGALTQNIRSEYDDPDEGNIFCDHLIVIKEIDQLQVSLRFNKSVAAALTERFGGEYDPLDGKTFTFRLVRDNPTGKTADTFDEKCVLGELTDVKFDTFMQYGYYKLVFNGVDFEGEKFEGANPSWIRLETFVYTSEEEQKTEFFTMNLIYEDHKEYSAFEEYKLSKKERP